MNIYSSNHNTQNRNNDTHEFTLPADASFCRPLTYPISFGGWTPSTCFTEQVASGVKCSLRCDTGYVPSTGYDNSQAVCVSGIWDAAATDAYSMTCLSVLCAVLLPWLSGLTRPFCS